MLTDAEHAVIEAARKLNAHLKVVAEPTGWAREVSPTVRLNEVLGAALEKLEPDERWVPPDQALVDQLDPFVDEIEAVREQLIVKDCTGPKGPGKCLSPAEEQVLIFAEVVTIEWLHLTCPPSAR